MILLAIWAIVALTAIAGTGMLAHDAIAGIS
jgi:hypothetical protein